MKNLITGIIIGGIIFTLGGVVAATTISSKNVIYQNKTVNTALDELYDEATTGKELVAAAITNKGITTTSTDTYETMATNINSIDTDHTEINQKLSNLESKHNSDIASLSGSISNLNSSFSWKFLKTVTGNTKIQLPDSYNEIIVDIENDVNYFSINLSRAQLSSSAKHYREGYYMNSTGASALATITATESSIFLNFLILGSEYATSSTKVSVYYR